MSFSNTLRGFYEWTQTLDKELVKVTLGSNLCLFCEWLVKHTVPYPDDKYNHAYCYDVFDTETGIVDEFDIDDFTENYVRTDIWE